MLHFIYETVVKIYMFTLYHGRRVGWHTRVAVEPIKKKSKKKSLSFLFISFFFIEPNDKFVSFSVFTFNLQIFAKLELQAKTVSAASLNLQTFITKSC